MDRHNNIPVMIPDVDRMIEYSTGIADEFLARLNRIRTFVPQHNLTSGTANEMILRNFLSNFLVGEFSVGQGFICNPTIPDYMTEHRISKQCDIIVYDSGFPLVHSEGEVKVVWPESVKLFIEVKTQLNKQELVGTKKQSGALDNIRAAKQVPYMDWAEGFIFAFRSSGVETVIKNLREYSGELSMDHAPTAILLLEEGVIIHRWLPVDPGKRDTFEIRRGYRGKKRATVIAFLIMFFFHVLLQNRMGTNIANMIWRMLQNKTERILEDFTIGDLK